MVLVCDLDILNRRQSIGLGIHAVLETKAGLHENRFVKSFSMESC